MTPASWRTGPHLADAEVGEFRLIVHSSQAMDGTARFLVLRRSTKTSPDALVGSGTAWSVPAAMRAAERMATRWSRAPEQCLAVA